MPASSKRKKVLDSDGDTDESDWQPTKKVKNTKAVMPKKNTKKVPAKTLLDHKGGYHDEKEDTWENEVDRVDIITKHPLTGKLEGWLVWKTTKQVTSHPLHLLYAKCPEKVRALASGRWILLSRRFYNTTKNICK